MNIINWLLRRLIIWPLADIAAWWDARPRYILVTTLRPGGAYGVTWRSRPTRCYLCLIMRRRAQYANWRDEYPITAHIYKC